VDVASPPDAGPRHLPNDELEAGLDEIRSSPADRGVLELIVRRPAVDERELLTTAELSLEEGLVGDTWRLRGSSRTDDGGPHPDMQLNIINSRLSRLIGGDEARHRALAGDQLHVDLDLSHENLPAGTRLAIGDAVVEVTAQPHTGCAKFASRFGAAALRFVNIGAGKELRLRGINARVVHAGTIRAGDHVTKL
jgi:hypothetical protein